MAVSVTDLRSLQRELSGIVKPLSQTFRLSYLTSVQQQRLFKSAETQLAFFERAALEHVTPSSEILTGRIMDDFVNQHCSVSRNSFVDFAPFETAASTAAAQASADFRDELRMYATQLYSVIEATSDSYSSLSDIVRACYVCDYLLALATISTVVSPFSSLYSRTFTSLYSWGLDTMTNLKQNSTTGVRSRAYTHFLSLMLRMFKTVEKITKRSSMSLSFSTFRPLLPCVPQEELNEEIVVFPYRKTMDFCLQSTDDVLRFTSSGLSDVDRMAEGERPDRTPLLSSIRLWLFRQLLRCTTTAQLDQKLCLRALVNRHMHIRWFAVFLQAVEEEQHSRVTFSKFLLLRRYVSRSYTVPFSTVLSICNAVNCDRENLTSISRITSNLVEQVTRLRTQFWIMVLEGQTIEQLLATENSGVLLATRVTALRKTFARYWQSLVYLATTMKHTTTLLSSGRTFEVICELLTFLVSDLQRFPVLDYLLFEESGYCLTFLDLIDGLFRVMSDAICNNTQSSFHASEIERLLELVDSFLSIQPDARLVEENLYRPQDAMVESCLRAVTRMLQTPRDNVLIPSVKNSNILDTLLFSFSDYESYYWQCLAMWRHSSMNILHYYLFRFVTTTRKTLPTPSIVPAHLQTRFSLEKYAEENGVYLAQLCAISNAEGAEQPSSLSQWKEQCELTHVDSVRLSRSGAISVSLNQRVRLILDESRQLSDTLLLSFLKACGTSTAALQLIEVMIARKKALPKTIASQMFETLLKMSVLRTEGNEQETYRRVFLGLLSKVDTSYFLDSVAETVVATSETSIARKAVRVGIASSNMTVVLSILRRWLAETCRTKSRSRQTQTDRKEEQPIQHVPYSMLSELVLTRESTDEMMNVVETLTANRIDAVQHLARCSVQNLDVPLLQFLTTHCDKTILSGEFGFDALDSSMEKTIYNLWSPSSSSSASSSSSSSSSSSAPQQDNNGGESRSDWNLLSKNAEEHSIETAKLCRLVHFWLVCNNLDKVQSPLSSASIVRSDIHASRSKSAAKKLQATFNRSLFDRAESKSSSSIRSFPSSDCNWSRLFFHSLFLGDTSLLSIVYSNIANDFCPQTDKTCEFEIAKFSMMTTHCLQSCNKREIASSVARTLRPTIVWLLQYPIFFVSDTSTLWALMEQMLDLEAIERQLIIAVAMATCQRNLFVPVRLILDVDDVDLFEAAVFRTCEDKSAISLLQVYNKAKTNVRSFLEQHARYPEQFSSSQDSAELCKAFWMVGCRTDAMMDPITMTRFEEVNNFTTSDIYSLDGGRNWLFLDTIMDLIRNSARERLFDGTHFSTRRKVFDPFTRARINSETLQKIVSIAERKASSAGLPFDNPMVPSDEIYNCLTRSRYTVVQSTTRIHGRMYIQIGLQHLNGAVLLLNVLPSWLEDNLDQYPLNPNEMTSAVLVRTFELIRSGQYFSAAAMQHLNENNTLHAVPTNDHSDFLEPVMPVQNLVALPHSLFASVLRTSTDMTDQTIYQQYLQHVAGIERL